MDPELIELARQARSWARDHCLGGLEGECGRYHGLRPYWRALDLVTTAAHHGFYRDRLDAWQAPARPPEILITGTADHALPAHALEIFRGRGVEPRITIVDRCRTPLAVCEWFARRSPASMKTFHGEILDYQPDRPFDLVLTHSFLGWFAPGERGRVVAKWWQLLRPGGMVLTVNHLRGQPDRATRRIPEDAGETEAFCAEVLERASRISDRLEVTPEQLAEWARGYRRGLRSYGIRSRLGLERDFHRAGFDVEISDLGAVPRREWRRNRDEQDAVGYIGVAATRRLHIT